MIFFRVVLLVSLLYRQTTAFAPLSHKKAFATMVPLSTTSSNGAYSHVKGVIFDIDGTLADSWKLGFDATVVVLEKNNVSTIGEEEYHEYTRYATPERLARHAGLLPGDSDFDQVGQRLGDEFDDLYVGLVNTETAGFYPGISSMLGAIPRDVAVGALTNACVGYAHAVLKTNCPVESSGASSGGIYSRFQSIRGADDVPTPKPSPDGLYVVCNDLELEPQDCIYIGDSPSDAAAAKAAGMGAIGVLWGSHAEEKVRAAPFDHVCRSVEELQALMPKRVVSY
jgi:phosphoglycolate phosphatase-like HAD superfamily hydrolase